MACAWDTFQTQWVMIINSMNDTKLYFKPNAVAFKRKSLSTSNNPDNDQNCK